MFAKLKDGMALCLEDYKDITKGCRVPPVNELWSQVEEYVDQHGWAEYVEPEPETPSEADLILAQRARAYADPVTGSDRFFVEAQRKRAAGDEQGAIEAEQKGLARVEKIKTDWAVPETEV